MKNLKNMIQNPGRDSKLWALWIWNQCITEEEIINQLNSFIEKGFGGVAVRASRDIYPAYLSEEFFKLFEKVLAVAKSNNIGVRIADDFSICWSKFYQRYAEQNCSYRAQYLVFEYGKVVSYKEVFEYELSDISSYIILASKIKDKKININNVKSLPISQKSSVVSWKAPAGEWQVMVLKKVWNRDALGCYIPNVFNPKIAQVYIQNVLEKFKSLFYKYIPSTLEGFFCEMPSYLPSKNGIPWDDDLVIKYRSRYKKNLLDILPVLFFDVHDSQAKNRSHIYNFIGQSMYERFPVFLEAWAKKNHLSQWVLSPERDINSTENMLKYFMAIPSIPLKSVGIQNQEGTDQNYPIVRAMADINSVEHKRETICIVGRNRKNDSANLQSIKTEIDQHLFLGNLKIVLDGYYFNLDHRSYIKTPFNPSWYHPEWNQMQFLCDYIARVLSLSQNLSYTRPVAVVNPASSIMADYLPNNDESIKKGIYLFRRVIDDLRSRNIDFDVISEQFLFTSPIKANGEFGPASRSRKGSYQAVIFPYSRLINNSVFVFLEKLAAKKGTIIFINEAPKGSFDDGQNASFKARVTKLTRPKNETVHIVSINEFISKLSNIEQIIHTSVNGKPCPDIHSACGTLQDCNIYLLHNNSEKRDHFVTVEIPETNHIYNIDFKECELHEIENVRNSDGISSFELDFSPKQTFILLSSTTKIHTSGSNTRKKHDINIFETVRRNYRVVLKDKWNFCSDSLNTIPLANWKTRIGLSRESGGYSHYYETYFETSEVPETFILAFYDFANADSLYNFPLISFEIAVNGVVIKPIQPVQVEKDNKIENSIDNFFGGNVLKYNIKESTYKGLNRITIRTMGNINDPGAIFYPPVIAGTFSARKGTRGWMINLTETEANYGSWTKHGYPYLSGSGIYQQVFEVPAEYKYLVLRFNQVSGSVSVKINETALGTINWQPIAFNITDAVEPRRNLLEVKVVNTIDTLQRMNDRDSGLMGEVYLDAY